MNRFLSCSIIAVLALGGCESTQTASTAAPGALIDENVEVGCGMCVYDMEGVQGCTLAAVIAGEPMLAEGTDLHLHDYGLCSGTRQAVVTGRIEGDTLQVTEIEVK